MSYTLARSSRSRIYTPPSQRKTRKFVFHFSFSLVLIIGALLVSLYSLLSPFEVLFHQPVLNVTEKKINKAEITDTVVAKQANETEIKLLNNQVNLQTLPSLLTNLPLERNWPVRGRITTYYSSYHPAIDIAAPRGSAMFSFASGVVTLAKSGGSLGNYIVIMHNNGYETMYGHLDRILVSVGQEVNITTQIGTVGSTGRSTGPHLHFQVSKDGSTINPLRVLP